MEVKESLSMGVSLIVGILVEFIKISEYLIFKYGIFCLLRMLSLYFGRRGILRFKRRW